MRVEQVAPRCAAVLVASDAHASGPGQIGQRPEPRHDVFVVPEALDSRYGAAHTLPGSISVAQLEKQYSSSFCNSARVIAFVWRRPLPEAK